MNTEDTLLLAEFEMVCTLRARGWAVALFTPAEVGDTDSEDLEGQMIAAGNDWLQEQRST